MTLEHVTSSLGQLVLNLRQLQADMIGTSTYIHVNIPANERENTHTKPLTQPEEATHHDKLHVLTHAHFSHHRHDKYPDTLSTIYQKPDVFVDELI